LLRAASPGGQVAGDGLVDLDEAGFLVDDVELVLIDQLVVAGAQLADGLVVLVHDGDVTVAVAIAGVVVALEAEEDILALPARGLEVSRPDAVDAVAGPDQVAVIAEDVGAGLAGTMLLGGRVGEAGKGGHKQVPFFHVLGCRDADVQPGRREVRPGAELPVGRGRSEQQVRHSEISRGLHGGAALRVGLSASATTTSILLNDRYIHLCQVSAPESTISISSTFSLVVS
jgi:hypothetical protein